MKQTTVPLNETAYFDFFPVMPQTAEEKLPLVVILPGGGYLYTSPRESDPVALRVNTHYMHALVLHYTTAFTRDVKIPELLAEVRSVLDWVRSHKDAYHIDTDRISVMGFSAGGNLAAHCSSQLAHQFDKAVLAYPATAFPRMTEQEMTDNFHRMFSRVASADLDENRLRQTMTGLLSLDPTKEISAKTRPTFIFQTGEDTMIDPMATVTYFQTLLAHSVPCEMVFYQNGPHGLSLADETCNPVPWPHQAKWFDQAMNWLKMTDKPGETGETK